MAHDAVSAQRPKRVRRYRLQELVSGIQTWGVTQADAAVKFWR